MSKRFLEGQKMQGLQRLFKTRNGSNIILQSHVWGKICHIILHIVKTKFIKSALRHAIKLIPSFTEAQLWYFHFWLILQFYHWFIVWFYISLCYCFLLHLRKPKSSFPKFHLFLLYLLFSSPFLFPFLIFLSLTPFFPVTDINRKWDKQTSHHRGWGPTVRILQMKTFIVLWCQDSEQRLSYSSCQFCQSDQLRSVTKPKMQQFDVKFDGESGLQRLPQKLWWKLQVQQLLFAFIGPSRVRSKLQKVMMEQSVHPRFLWLLQLYEYWILDVKISFLCVTYWASTVSGEISG